MLSKTEAEKPREHRIHAGEEKPVSGAPGRGDCAAEAEPPMEGIGTGSGDDSWITSEVCKVLLWGFIPPRRSQCSLSTGDSLSLPQHLRNFCGSLKHRGTAPNFWLIMGVSLSKLSKTLKWQLFSFCALLGLQESFFTWEPHCPGYSLLHSTTQPSPSEALSSPPGTAGSTMGVPAVCRHHRAFLVWGYVCSLLRCTCFCLCLPWNSGSSRPISQQEY